MPVVFWSMVLLMQGCGGAFSGEQTLKKDGLALTYRSVNRIFPDIDTMPLQHPARISQDTMRRHLLSLRYGKPGSGGGRKAVFTPKDAGKISRLLAKALNRARRDRYIHFEFAAAKGATAGEVFAGDRKIHWVFTEINGVDYSNDPLGIRKRTWKLAPQQGQRYYFIKTDFGKKPRENWIVADLLPPRPSRKPVKSMRSEPASSSAGKTGATDKRELLRFLKHLREKGLIDDAEYEREKKDLMKK
ncbi:MAG: SHOCT domain-containing protein [Nitrospinales bacterium]